MTMPPTVSPRSTEQGIAMIATLMVLLLMTLLGVAALTLTIMEHRVANLSRTADAASNAAESCLGAGVRVIQATITDSELPSSALDTASPPGPVPSARQTDLTQEIMGQSDQDPDSEVGTGSAGPDLLQTVGGFAVAGDIDRLYLKSLAGGSAQFGGGTTTQMEIYYRVRCRASWTATGTMAQVSAIYACTMTGGESCQKTMR
jgi:hypothetical protein